MDNGRRGKTGQIAVKIVEMILAHGPVAATFQPTYHMELLVQGMRNSPRLVLQTRAPVSRPSVITRVQDYNRFYS